MPKELYVCKNCGYSRLSHMDRNGLSFSSSVRDASRCRDFTIWKLELKSRPLADVPCNDYERDNLIYLESISGK